MDGLIRLRLACNGGVISTAELLDLGLDDHGVRALVRRGDLVRARSGAFVDGAHYRSCDSSRQHALRARAIVRRMDGYALSHVSALAALGLPLVAVDLQPVHLAGVGKGRARKANGLVVHPEVSAHDVVVHDGVPTVQTRLSILHTAALSAATALSAADVAIRTKVVEQRDLLALVEGSGRFSAAAHRVAALSNGLAESPGESLTRLLLDELGVVPEQQVEIRDAGGRFVARVDFLVVDDGVVIEFDGAVKYQGAGGSDALFEEKRREDRLRALGYRVVRLVWDEVRHPARVAASLTAAGVTLGARPQLNRSAVSQWISIAERRIG